MKKRISINKFTFSALVGIALIFLFTVVSNIGNQGVISWDAFGYYYYLRLAFIDHSMIIPGIDALRPIFEKYEPSSTLYQFTLMADGRQIIRYPVGQAILYLPFFIIAHLSALFSKFPADGFSKPYQLVMLIGGMVYNILGFVFTAKILRRRFSDSVVAITLFLILLGTNTYAIIAGGAILAQGSLFFLFALFIWLVDSYFRNKKHRVILASGIIFGLICLTRPTDCLLIIPAVLWPLTIPALSLKTEIREFFVQIKRPLLFSLPVILCALIQMSYWKYAGGSWFIESYANPAEGFDFLTPHTIPFLFSFRSGWLLYTPLMGLVLIVLIIESFRGNKTMQIILIFTILYVYVASSWTNWWYGGSFSQRPMIEAYILLSIPLAFLVQYAFFKKRKFSFPISILILFFFCLSIWQTIQSKTGVLPGKTITREYYLASFFDLEPDSSKTHLLSIDRSDFYIQPKYNLPEGMKLTKSTDIKIPSTDRELENRDFIPEVFNFSYQDLTDKDYCFILITAVFEGLPPKNAGMVTTFDHGGAYGYQFKGLRENIVDSNLTTNQYISTVVYLTPYIRNKVDKFSAYIWNQDKEPGKLIRLRMEVYENPDSD